MRLWVDGQCLQTASRLRGIGRYALEFMTAIAEYHPDVELIISFNAALPDEAMAARETVKHLVAPHNIHVWHSAADGGEAKLGFSPKRRLSEAALCYHVDTLAPDIALSTSPFEGMMDFAVPLFPGPTSKALVASIFYDAIPYRFAEHYLGTELTKAAYMRRLDRHDEFDLSLCISEFSMREIQAIIPGANVAHISTGVSPHFLDMRAHRSADAPALGYPYLLCVGGLDWRKNVAAVVEAFRFLPEGLRQSHRLVVVGDYEAHLRVELEDRWNGHGLPREGMVFPGHVTEAGLLSLYERAGLLIQPSFMEGFGLTAVEAMMCGTPVIAARAGALPEVVGDERLLFDPQSPQEMAVSIARVLTDEALRKEILRDNRVRAGQFSWKRTADLAVTALQTCVAERGQRQTGDEGTIRQRYAAWAATQRFDEAAPMAFALAEPPVRDKQTRLIIDATSTMLVDHKTGIQRVVNKICQNIFDGGNRQDKRRVLAYCDDTTGFFDGHADISRPAIKSEGNRLHVSASDHILMLDSSWAFHEVHRPFFRAARLRGASITSCLYDLVPLQMPAFCDAHMPFAFGEWFRTALTYSTGFVCISRAVADELHALLTAINYPRAMKIGYWRLGADFVSAKPVARTRSIVGAASRPAGAVFLMVGTLEPRKGHRVAIDAFERLWADGGEGSDAQLVIVGKKGWGVDAMAEAIRAHPEFGRRLIWHAGVSDAELVGLYADCDALLSASFAEGFGLPLVEAAHFGKPVIASDIPVFREVADPGTGAEFFTVGSSQSLYEATKAFIVKQRARPHRHTPPKSEWPTWADSAHELEALLVSEDWYKIYEPAEAKAFTPLSNIGDTGTPRPYGAEERSYRLQLVNGPTPDAKLGCTRYLVALTNLSESAWLGQGTAAGLYGVGLSYHVLSADGTCVKHDNPRTKIPFVMLPGETKVLTVEVPISLKGSGAGWIDLELVQEGCAWWSGGLRVPI